MCGIAGVFVSPGSSAVGLTYDLLLMLQDRGQDAAGIAASDGHEIIGTFGEGLVDEALSKGVLRGITGHICVGHTRYATSGSASLWSAQPMHRGSGFFIAENGDLVKAGETGQDLLTAVESDTDVLANLLDEYMQKHRGSNVAEALKAVLPNVSGGYALVVMDETSLIAVCDPRGIRPLCLGRLDNGWVVASENSAFGVIDAQYIRDIGPGEILQITKYGLKSEPIAPLLESEPEPEPKPCIFENVYFAHPNNLIRGREVYGTRFRMGERLAEQAPLVDRPGAIVIGVPDSGIPASKGYAKASGLPHRDGFSRNRYAGRTFIRPNPASRAIGVRRKLHPLVENIRGEILIVVDDSIVRGVTTRAIVTMLRKVGAREVHLRISSPPYRWPCFYGMATANQGELIASQFPEDQLAEQIGCDSLEYLSLPNLLAAVPPGGYCTACLSGDYPVEVPVELMRFKIESQLSQRAMSGSH